LRVANLILPSLAVLALTGASSASASTNGGGATPSSAAGTSTAAPTTASSTAQPSYAGTTQGPGQCTGSPTASATSGGAGVGGTSGSSGTSAALPCPHPTVPGDTAEIIHGLAYAPADAPLQVQNAIWAGDRIRLKPYRVGGGHGKWNDTAYDCSGTVSYVLHAAGLLKISEDSGQMESWDRRGTGQWITVYTNPGHAFIEMAGIRLDTSGEGDPHPPPGTGPRWRPLLTDTSGFMPRHPAGL
jgi:hypothetical protein